MGMHAVIYRVYIADKYDGRHDAFNETEIMNEYQLRQFFREQADGQHIHPDNLRDYDLTVQEIDNDVYGIDLDMILDILNDNDQYTDGGTSQYPDFCVAQESVSLSDDDIYD